MAENLSNAVALNPTWTWDADEASSVEYMSEQFRFLDLPVEIQVMVLRELLASAYNIRIVERRRPSNPLEWMMGAFYERRLMDTEVTPLQAYNRRETAASRVFPAILQTCRRLKKLGEPILYSENTFTFVVATAARMYFDDFCQSIGRQNASLIKKIQFVIWIYGPERGSGINKQVPHVPGSFPGCNEVAFLMWEIALMPLGFARSMWELERAGKSLIDVGWECCSNLTENNVYKRCYKRNALTHSKRTLETSPS